MGEWRRPHNGFSDDWHLGCPWCHAETALSPHDCCTLSENGYDAAKCTACGETMLIVYDWYDTDEDGEIEAYTLERP
jgi:hypothetical protein